jgi:hypothetical protein
MPKLDNDCNYVKKLELLVERIWAYKDEVKNSEQWHNDSATLCDINGDLTCLENGLSIRVADQSDIHKRFSYIKELLIRHIEASEALADKAGVSASPITPEFVAAEVGGWMDSHRAQATALADTAKVMGISPDDFNWRMHVVQRAAHLEQHVQVLTSYLNNIGKAIDKPGLGFADLANSIGEMWKNLEAEKKALRDRLAHSERVCGVRDNTISQLAGALRIDPTLDGWHTTMITRAEHFVDLTERLQQHLHNIAASLDKPGLNYAELVAYVAANCGVWKAASAGQTYDPNATFGFVHAHIEKAKAILAEGLTTGANDLNGLVFCMLREVEKMRRAGK